MDLAKHSCFIFWGDYKSNWVTASQTKCWFLVRGENWSTQGETCQSREENQQTQPKYDSGSGKRTRATLMEDDCSHHCTNDCSHHSTNPALTTAPTTAHCSHHCTNDCPHPALTTAPRIALTIAPTIALTTAPTTAHCSHHCTNDCPHPALTTAPRIALTIAPTIALTIAPTIALTTAPTIALTTAPTIALTNAPAPLSPMHQPCSQNKINILLFQC